MLGNVLLEEIEYFTALNGLLAEAGEMTSSQWTNAIFRILEQNGFRMIHGDPEIWILSPTRSTTVHLDKGFIWVKLDLSDRHFLIEHRPQLKFNFTRYAGHPSSTPTVFRTYIALAVNDLNNPPTQSGGGVTFVGSSGKVAPGTVMRGTVGVVRKKPPRRS